MKVEIDKNGVITGYCTIGDIDGSVEMELPEEVLQNFQPGRYLVQDGQVLENPAFIPPMPLEDAERIAELKKALYDTDYQVIKCMEAQLLGAPAPYVVDDLHAQRQAWRDEINALGG